MNDELQIPSLAAPEAIPAAPLPLPQQGQQPPQQAQAQGKWSQAAPLMALIPLAMAKGGQPAVAALLAGYQRKLAEQQQQGQQQFQNNRLTANDQAEAEYRRQTLENQRLTAQGQLRSQFTGALDRVESPEAVNALLDFFGAQGASVGLTRDALSGFAQQYAPPSKLEQRKAQNKIAAIEKAYPDKNVLLQLEQAGTKFEGKTLGEWRLLAGAGGTDAQGQPVVAPAPPAQTDRRGFTTKDILHNGKRILAGYDPDTNTYYAPGDTKTALTGDIQEYQKPESAGGGAAGDARTNARIDRIVNSFNGHPIVKEYNEVQAQHGIIQQVASGPWSGPGDMAAVFAFMKALDPNSVVRETEYANASRSGNIFSGWAARFNGALSPSGGFLSEQVRRDFLRTIESRLNIKTQQYNNLRRQLVSRVDRIKAGAPETGDEALIDYASGVAAPKEPGHGRATVTPSQAPPVRSGGAGPGANPFRRHP